MKEESVLNILMYLFKNHMHENCELDAVQDELLGQLKQLGFQDHAIDRAFTWLDRLAEESYSFESIPTEGLTRVFTTRECERFTTQSRSLLIYLEQEGILDARLRELVINQSLALNLPQIDEHLLKWVTLMVLFNQPNTSHSLARMEFLTLDESTSGIH